MPGYSEFLDVQNTVKVMLNAYPSDTSRSSWDQLHQLADTLQTNTAALAIATAKRSQGPLAQECNLIAAQLEEAIGQVLNTMGEGDEPEVEAMSDAGLLMHSLRGTIAGFQSKLDEFDEERLQRK